MISIEHVPERVETIIEFTDEPNDSDEILDERKADDPAYDTVYKVRRDVTVTEEQYIVRTTDGIGSEHRTYWVRQNGDGDWAVDKRRTMPANGHATVKTGGDLSTDLVRQRLRERYGIEVIN